MATEDKVILELLKSHAYLTSLNPTLELGQKVIVTGIASSGYYPTKIGDGTTAYNDLDFVTQTLVKTAADFTSDNPTLSEGRIGSEIDTGKIKIGDSTTAWTSLPYVTDLQATSTIDTLIVTDSVDMEDASTIYYAPVSGEESMGTLHMFNDTTNRSIYDATVGITWEQADFSAFVPSGTKGLLLFMDISNAGVDQGIICFGIDESISSIQRWNIGDAYLSDHVTEISPRISIAAPEGKFYYAEYNATTWAIASVYFRIRGYYI